MAIKATKLQSEYRKALNRLNSNFDRRVPIVDGDQYINEAIDKIFENFASRFEVNKTLRNHLRQLEVKNQSLELEEKSDFIEAKIPDNYYMSTRQYGIGTTKNCDKERLIELFVVQTSDLTNALRNPFWKPSFYWEEALIEEAGDSLIIYNGDIKFNKVVIDYLRKPGHIATPSLIGNGNSYINSDGETLTEDIDFEIDATFFWRKVVRLAALNTLLDLGDINNYQAKLNNIMALDQTFLQ